MTGKLRPRGRFVVARNFKGRPTLQHRLMPDSFDTTACGRPIESWSRAYQASAIAEILCKNPNCWEGPDR